MHYLWQHLESILSGYDGKLPLHHFLKNYFKAHPKLGSRDRRGLSDAVYAWYRAGKALSEDTHELQIKRLAAMQLCGLHPKAFASFFPAEWPDDATSALPDTFQVRLDQLFPFDIPFSKGITADEWRRSMLQQPRLFLRVRKSAAIIKDLLSERQIPNEWISSTCLGLPNGTKVDDLLPQDAYVVQDASSQATGSFLKGKSGEYWWDCCSGAGGKSLMLSDSAKGISLLATDVRESILQNLAARFRLYHLPLPERQVLDAANGRMLAEHIGNRRFDGIICDVPCSGSGTWARTPESSYFFKPEALAQYSTRQHAILSNAVNYVKTEGRVVYITCSVFKAENEDVIRAVADKAGMKIETAQLINGIAIEADSLFVAVLRKA